MRPILAIAALAAASVLASGGSAASGGKAATTCDTAGEKVLLQNSVAVVTLEKDQILGCSKENGNRTEFPVGQDLTTSLPPAMALRGHYLGFVEAFADIQDLDVTVKATDLRYDRDTQRPVILFSADPGSVANFKEVGSVAVSSRGSLAWINCPESNSVDAQISPSCRRPGLQDIIYRFDAGSGKLARVASGRNIDPDSLKRVGGSIRWRQGSRRITAPMT
jgi:hypothetical protein